MTQVNINDEIDLKEIFGQKNGNKKPYFIDIWTKKYPILQVDEVLAWIKQKIWKFKSGGKDPRNFNFISYVKSIQEYVDFYKSTISELLTDELDQRNTKLLNYLNQLISNGKNPVSVKNAYQSRIKSFFSNRGKPITEGLETESSGINKDEIMLNKDLIKKIYNKLESPNYRVINKFQTCLGLRIEDVLVELISGKYKIETYQDYFFIRNFMTQKELVRINFLFFPQELSILLKATYNCDDLTRLDLIDMFNTSRGGKIRKSDYLRVIKLALEKLGIKGNGKTHAYRKFFESSLNSVRAINKYEEIAIIHLMGRTLDKKTDKSYLQKLNDIQFMFDFFKKVEPYISIDTEFVNNQKSLEAAVNTIKESFDLLLNHLNPEDRPRKTIEDTKKDNELVAVIKKIKNKLNEIKI